MRGFLKIFVSAACGAILWLTGLQGAPALQSKHGATPLFTGVENSVFCGYQAWYRCPQDGSNKNWKHYAHKSFSPQDCTIDFWPDVSEYINTFETPFNNKDNSGARVFSSYDPQVIDTHFKWMAEHKIKGAFLQRFFRHLENPDETEIVKNCLASAKKHGVALILMYDLSGLKDGEDTAPPLIDNWKRMVDEIGLTAGDNSAYMTLKGRPLVAIWGIGFKDRPYNAESCGIEKFLKFLKQDPQYGNCAVMLGVPAFFRTLEGDALPDEGMHALIKKYADIVSPWNVGRYVLKGKTAQCGSGALEDIVRADKKWCDKLKIAYMPVIYPGFSWHNMHRDDEPVPPMNQIPRANGEFYMRMAEGAARGGANALYVAMFDEMDEGTAIFKCASVPPNSAACRFLDYEGQPSDYYLKLTKSIAKALEAAKTPKFEKPPKPQTK